MARAAQNDLVWRLAEQKGVLLPKDVDEMSQGRMTQLIDYIRNTIGLFPTEENQAAVTALVDSDPFIVRHREEVKVKAEQEAARLNGNSDVDDTDDIEHPSQTELLAHQ